MFTLTLALLGLVGVLGLTAAAANGAETRTYYVDQNGSDGSTGTSPHRAWKSLAKISSSTLHPGDTVLLRRGQTFTGKLAVTRSGLRGAMITIGAFGTGVRPRVTGTCVDVTGSFVTIRGLNISHCAWAGVAVSGDHVRVQSNRVSHNVAGVHVRSGADHTLVIGNLILDNQKMSVNTPGGDDDSGAFGVLVNGDHTDITHNRISGQHAASYDYGVDGSAVEIYGAIGTSVHHNIARQNHAFTELGDPRTSGTTYAYNAVTSNQADADFLVTRGAGSGWGPVTDTLVEHNTVKLTGAGSEGFVCYAGCSPGILAMHSNVVVAAWKVGYADAPFDVQNNVFWGGQIQFQKSASDVVSAPDFTSTLINDVQLTSGSPAVDQVTTPSWVSDVFGGAVPRDGNGDGTALADIGAYERP